MNVVKENLAQTEPESNSTDISHPIAKEWLKQGKNFRYECEHGNVTIMCDKQENWTASKKVDQKLRRKRIGKAKDINRESLRAVTKLLCNQDDWNEYQAGLRAKRKPKQNKLEETIARLYQVIDQQKQTIQELKQKNTGLAIELSQYKYAETEDL